MTELMFAERKERIRALLRQNGRVVAAALASEFNVSEDTIRRDLRELAAAGLCERVYGGALPVSKGSSSLSQRMAVAVDRKRNLAGKAVGFITPRSVVYLDAGSTNLAVAEALGEDLPVTVITNAPAIATALADKLGVETILVGGTIDRMVGGTVGANAIAAMAALRPDLCLIGTCAIDAEGGLSAFGFEDAAFKRFVLSRSRRTMVLATADKFEASAPYAFADAGQYQLLVTERGADAGRLGTIKDKGCEIVLA
ncbi:DeoR/GlpR family DNA-binding transcription regulator [Rhizobium sp. SAFR-030]|uniref:DeoR/GlpR family DNA-binding transcription regulator n=1 Tax=Rhizobium sp. SAFR-030 TaxID=3387277 RepID=UPI003F7D9CFE